MRFSLSLVAVFSTLVLSANGAAIHKRAAASVETCVSSLNTIVGQIGVLEPSIQSGGIIDTSVNNNRVDDAIKNSQGLCCAINVAISETDADYVTSAFGNVTTKVQNLTTEISQKKTDYSFFAKTIIHLRIKKLRQLIENLDTCIINLTPDTKKAALQTYITSVELAFDQISNAYAL